MALELTSPAFADGGPIPRQHTCEGNDLSPPLAWTGAPDATRSFALVVADPDAPDPAHPRRTWIHWVLYNLPANSTGLAGGADPLPSGCVAGLNDWRRHGYGGPCPPVGRHRYIHELYALDVVLPQSGDMTRDALRAAMAGHILAEARLTGTYQKTG